MIEKIQGISIQGQCFSACTSLKLYPKATTRLAIVYGKNGSGKSTITKGIKSVFQKENTELSSFFIGENSIQVPISEEDKRKIHVFNEEYIDNNIKLNSDGLGTIVLLGTQVDLQNQIKTCSEQLEHVEAELGLAESDLLPLTTESDPQSPEFHYKKIRQILQGHWAKIDGNIRKKKINSSVTNSTIEEIWKLTPKKTKIDLENEFHEKQLLFEKVSVPGIVIPATIPIIKPPTNFEAQLNRLLNKKIEKTVLSEREQQILSAIETGQQRMVEDAKKTFESENVQVCPYCYQEISDKYKKSFIESINRVLNKDVDLHKAELAEIVYPSLPTDYSMYNTIDSEMVALLNKKLRSCNSLIEKYKSYVEQKLGNMYTPIEIEPIGVENAIEDLNVSLRDLERKRIELSTAQKAQSQLSHELILLNKKIAYWDIHETYKTYLDQKEKQTNARSRCSQKKQERDDLRKELIDLKQKKSNTHLAVDRINSFLSYVFFDSNRLKIEHQGEKYFIKSNNKDVSPRNVSIGERNIIALCYFFVEIQKNKEINQLYKEEQFIVVDDPISSFDFENKVGVTSFIRYQAEKILGGNDKSKILILSHDLTTVFNLEKVAVELLKNNGFSVFELKNRDLVTIQKNYSEYKELLHSVYYYASSTQAAEDVSIGNSMRRVLEAFSTFVYRKGIVPVFSEKSVIEALKEKSEYFKNRMLRLVLHGESHCEEQIYTLHDSANFYQLTSIHEKQKCAQAVLCFIYLLNPMHIEAYLNKEHPDAIPNIKTWIGLIPTNNDF